MNAALKVAVVGGGWAGLATAVELGAAGATVTVFEAAKQLGGRARGVAHGDRLLDNGQHILLGAYHETLRLMRKVGADPDRLLERCRLELAYPAAGFALRLPKLPAPFNLGVGLLAARGCSFSEKLAAARFVGALRATAYRLRHDVSVAELLDRHGQHGALRSLLWEALCLAALNTKPAEASAQIFANVLRDSLGGERADTDLLLPKVGLGRIFPELAARFVLAHGGAVRLSARVSRIGRGFCVDGEPFDKVVVATAPQHAQALLETPAETAAIAALLKNYRYEPIATVYLGYAPALTLPQTMLGLGQGAADTIGQWAFDHGALAGEAGLIACVLSASGIWQGLDNAALAFALHRELEAALGRHLAPPAWQFVVREKRATFACRPGLPRPAAATALPGLWLAGDYVCADYPATLEGAIRSGVAAAHGVLGGA